MVAVLVGIIAAGAPASGQVINEDLKLLSNDGATFDWFGWSVAVSSGVVAVTAAWDDDNGTDSGSAYLFDASTGVQLHKLLPNDGAYDDRFGWSIAMDSGVVAVGSAQDGDNGFRSGSGYLFDASTGNQLFKLLSSDGEPEDKFGYCIAMDNGVVAVGAPYDIGGEPGSAYLFDVSTGDELAILLPGDDPPAAQFGISIAIHNGIVAVGAYLDDASGTNSGSAYLFNASTGAELFKLLPLDGVANDYFGWSIAIRNGIVAVGASQDDDNGADSGSVYLFDAFTGAQIDKLLPDDGAVGDQFGSSISMDNGVVAVGAKFSSGNGPSSGSAYLFEVSTGAQIAKLLPTDNAALDVFGHAIAITNGLVAVGAINDGDNGDYSGSVTLFSASVAQSLQGESTDLLVQGVDGSGTLTISYQPSCGAANHNIVYGPLQDVGTYAYTGQDCGVGNSGSYNQFDPGAGSFFFLVVGTDGATTEGSYGRDSALSERPEDLADPVCFFTQALGAGCS